MGVVTEIPVEFRAEAEAARNWFSRQHDGEFKITGFVEDDDSVQSGETRDLQLILCGELKGEEVCLREQIGRASCRERV